MMTFVLMYNDCVNLYGWQKRAEFKCKKFRGDMDFDKKVNAFFEKSKKTRAHTTYCEVNNAEFMPDLCNEFVTIYLDEADKNLGKLSRNVLMDFTNHFCHWLFINRLTCYRIEKTH